VLGGFVAMAKIALGEGHKDVAAVLACAALEDTLKRFGRLNGLDVDDKVLQEVVARSEVQGTRKWRSEVIARRHAKIRDYAMHANWSKIDAADVRSVLGFVEQFLLTKFRSAASQSRRAVTKRAIDSLPRPL
jgi:hypothetical protein